MGKHLLEHRKQGVKEHHDFEFFRKDGTKLTALLNTAPNLDKAGNYNGAIAGVTDITYRRQMEDDLKLNIAKLKKPWKGSSP